MTRERAEIDEKVRLLILQELGGERLPWHIESSGPFVMKGDTLGIPTYSELYAISDKKPASLQEALRCTSLETVSIQMAIEEAFDLKFATGPADRLAIDDEWDACKSIEDIDALVEKWTKDPSEGTP